MSHAAVIVAISSEELASHGGIEQAVDWNMLPFSEEGHWGMEGSRWDWYVIGGRYTGLLQPDYDPSKDPRNIIECWLCDGTGKRPDMEVPDGCNGCQGTGKTMKWNSEWANVGNIATRHQLEEHADNISAYAFLKNRTWFERARVGMWGMTAKTECEIKAEVDGDVYEGRCIWDNAQAGSRIVSFDEDESDRWGDLYWARFLRNLPPETVLVVVDYHV